MVDKSVNIVIQDNKGFDYNFVRSKYFEACSMAYDKPIRINGPWTIKAREYMIECLKNSEINPGSMYDFNTDFFTKYQIVLDDGVEKLVLTGSAVEVLPYEESFDIFVDAHTATDHGDFRATKAVLEDSFVVEDTCLKYFLANCNVCHRRSIRTTKPTKFNDIVVIEILKLPVKDFDSEYILFYMDKGTTFKLFKPLMSIDESEISIELFKIFTDFGPPLTIETQHIQLLNQVLSTLAQTGLKYSITVKEVNTYKKECCYLIEYILNKSDPKGGYWTTTSRFVQYSHNANDLPVQVLRRSIPAISPFNQLFAYQHGRKKEKLKTTHGNSSTQINLDSSDEEINETMDTDVEYCGTSKPVTSNSTTVNFEDMIVKHEITVKETVVKDPLNKDKANSTQIESVRIAKTTTKSMDLSFMARKESIENKFCSDCKGRMFSDFFCFGCKKPTHMFCLTRVIHSSNKEQAQVVTFLYCRFCKIYASGDIVNSLSL